MPCSQTTAAVALYAACFGFGIAMAPSSAVCQDAAPPVRPGHALADHPNRPEAAAGDVSSIDAIVAAFANSISAPAGGEINRKRLNSIFVPGGRIAIGIDPRPGHAADVVFVSPDGYADLADRGLKSSGFFDHVIANHVERFGIMAHVYSAYGSGRILNDPKPFRRGIKSFNLLLSGGRWYVVDVFYDFERPEAQLPLEYLTPSTR